MRSTMRNVCRSFTTSFYGGTRHMKSLGTEPSPRSSRIHWLVLGAAVTFCGALTVAACIPAGSCDDDCGEGMGGGGTGGGGGGKGGAAPAGPPGDLPVADCEAYTTIAEVEKEIVVRTCGSTTVCHANATQTDLKTAGIAMRLLDKAPKAACLDDKLIDSAAP